MRKQIVAGNWKMNMSLGEGMELAREINDGVATLKLTDTGVILGIPYIHLAGVSRLINHENISLAAQNCAAWDKGAYTGEVSAEMIKSTGTEYVILGHSERRKYFHENSAMLNNKVKLALENELNPIFCCGEVLEEREDNRHFQVVQKQISEALFDLEEDDFRKIIIAYEPVWAIGTGVTATSDQAQEMHAFIRKEIIKKFGDYLAEEITLLYGGSCKPSNARELFSNPDVDGGLIGGASLKTDDFLAIIQSF